MVSRREFETHQNVLAEIFSVFFENTNGLDAKLEGCRKYYNPHHVQQSFDGDTPSEITGEPANHSHDRIQEEHTRFGGW